MSWPHRHPGNPGFMWIHLPGHVESMPVATRVITSSRHQASVASLVAVPALEEIPFDAIIVPSILRRSDNPVVPVGLKLFWVPYDKIHPLPSAEERFGHLDFLAEPDLQPHLARLALLYPHTSEVVSRDRHYEIREIRSLRPSSARRRTSRSRLR